MDLNSTAHALQQFAAALYKDPVDRITTIKTAISCFDLAETRKKGDSDLIRALHKIDTDTNTYLGLLSGVRSLSTITASYHADYTNLAKQIQGNDHAVNEITQAVKSYAETFLQKLVSGQAKDPAQKIFEEARQACINFQKKLDEELAKRKQI